VRFQHDFSNPDRVPLGDVHLEVDSGETELAKIKPFKFTKPFSAGHDVELLSETIVSIIGVELRSYPIVVYIIR
jgi:hypothetical protein